MARIHILEAEIGEQAREYDALALRPDGLTSVLQQALLEQQSRLSVIDGALGKLATDSPAPLSGQRGSAGEAVQDMPLPDDAIGPPANVAPSDGPPSGSLSEAMAVGDGVAAYRSRDFVRALEIWRPLAEAGNARAQFHLGALYYEGRGVSRDFQAAYLWLTRSARGGDAHAPTLLTQLQTEMDSQEIAEAQRLLSD